MKKMKKDVYLRGLGAIREMWRACDRASSIFLLNSPLRKKECKDTIGLSHEAVANCAVITKEGWDHSHNSACHAGLGEGYEMEKFDGEVLAIASKTQMKSSFYYNSPLSIRFYDWLLNRSPWAEVFVTKSGKLGARRGVVCHTNVPSNLLLGGLIASRVAWEHINIMATWGKLTEAGVDESLAFFLAHGVDLSYKEASFNGMAGHCALRKKGISERSLEAFYRNIPVIQNELYSSDRRYNDIHATFEHTDKTIDFELLMRNLKRKGGNILPNPFARSIVHSSNVSSDEALLFLVDYSSNLIKEWNNA